ncbi:MAG: 4Fe-4S dicluster domain-containing protein [Clostridia bacterium]|nr:4Fe-4S dicluster domain-containing protein [Clostridia bacterium]
MKKISMSSLNGFFAKIAEGRKLYLPIEKAGQVDFYEWNENEKVRLDVLKTIKSAKDVFFPQVEDLLKFRMDGKSIEISECPKNEEDFVVFGVRGCDAKSFEVLDKVFLVDPRDEFYAARRAHGTVVTLACGEPEEACFCTNFDVNPARPAGDATAWIIGDEMYIEANTEKGAVLIAELEEAEGAAVAEEQKKIEAICERLPFAKLNLEGFDGEHLMEKFNDPQWETLSRACMACGTCTFVCPTCQCYDIRDFDNGKSVTRYRCWDSCMYSDFTLMAHGNNRQTQAQRFRQRFMHKLVYFPSNNDGMYSCVGCGRCVQKCPQNLNIVKVIKALGVKEK